MRIDVENLSFSYGRHQPVLKNVSFSVSSGEILGITGPSGCGKSTLAGLTAGYLRPDSGRILIDGRPMPKKCFNPVQLIYQHPELSLNPRWKLSKSLCEAWTPNRELLEELGIEEAWLGRYPVELSGGELQRLCIARALAPETRFLICDEISTMLDAVTQAQLWRLLLKIKDRNNLGLIVITHSKALAGLICGRTLNLPDL